MQAILGPAPEEWDEFYRGVTNPPKNPYRGEREQSSPAARATGNGDAEAGQGARPETAPAIESEKEPTELDVIRQTHGRRLRLLLLAEHDHFQRHSPAQPEHQEALRRMDLLEAEMRRRGNKVPPRPEWREPNNPPEEKGDVVPGRPKSISELEGTELMQRLFKARAALPHQQADGRAIMSTPESTSGPWKPRRNAATFPLPPPQTFNVVGFRDFSASDDPAAAGTARQCRVRTDPQRSGQRHNVAPVGQGGYPGPVGTGRLRDWRPE